MDAAEADADVKLYKASAELLLELRAKVPRLVRDVKRCNKLRKWVIHSKVSEITRLLDSFQEWPQLLDPYLSELVQILVDAYFSYCVTDSKEYLREHDSSLGITPLPRAVARVLYAFSKVRGHKVIVRLLNNEPKLIEPLMSCFWLWTSDANFEHLSNASTMTWEERYIHLLWLSHLMLAPFELSTISGLSALDLEGTEFSNLLSDLPTVSINLATAGLNHLYVSGKAREAATTLLVRLSSRGDMQRLGLVHRLITWASSQLTSSSKNPQNTGYHDIGLLGLLFGIINSSSNSEAAPFLSTVFETAYLAATSSLERFDSIRDSALARKLLVKIMRSCVTHAIAIENTITSSAINLDLNAMLENCIQTLLEFLADKDTPVRQAASKAISLICLKLEIDLATDIVEAVIDSLNENMLLENIANGALFPITDVVKSDSIKYKKNLNAVDPLKWHGCMLTLGHLLFRRSLPTSLLPGVIEVLLMGLDFEQRSNVGTSIGVGVRDAACFGIWSLARKYSTAELAAVHVSDTLSITSHPNPTAIDATTLQLVASCLAVSACLDPSGNLRRGSSAALQELIGRHPDAITQGISVVQTIDYHAVARRSRAMTEVAVAASKLSGHYHRAILHALLAWRGVRATDAESRREAAQAAGLLVSTASEKDTSVFLNAVISKIRDLRMTNTGTNASARHGLLCCLAAVLESTRQSRNVSLGAATFRTSKIMLEDIPSIIGNVGGRVTTDIENVLEATSLLILACASFISIFVESIPELSELEYPSKWAASIKLVLNRCTIASDKDFVTSVAAQANVAVLKLLPSKSQTDVLSSWLDQEQQNRADFTCKGRIVTVGHVFECADLKLGHELDQSITDYLADIVCSSCPIETKVNAMQSITTILASTTDIAEQQKKILVTAVCSGLADYTTDQRGDIGSLMRLESIEAVKNFDSHKIDEQQMEQTLQLIVKLAAEKLVKVRFESFKCLERYVDVMNLGTGKFDHQADVSSFEYYQNLLTILEHPQFSEHLIIGLISSMAGGTEEISRACGEAFVSRIQSSDSASQSLIIISTIRCVTHYLDRIAHGDDREVIPALDFMSFFIEHILVCQPKLVYEPETSQIWDVCLKVHVASASLARIESMIRMYSALALLDPCRIQALDKLTRFLLHRWPRIRGAAADAVFLYTATPSLVLCDWNAPVTDNKPTVLALRKEFKVAGSTAKLPALQTNAGA